MFYAGQEKRWTFNTGDCLLEVTAWAGLTIFITWISLKTKHHIKNVTMGLMDERFDSHKWKKELAKIDISDPRATLVNKHRARTNKINNTT